MADEVYKACARKGPDGMHCERRKDHDGPHAALDGDVKWQRGDDP